MIANIKNNASSKGIKKYLAYCITPKAENAARYGENGVHRVVSFYADGMECNVNQVDGWMNTLEENSNLARGGKLTAKSYKCLTGVIAFSPEDDVTPQRAIEIVRNLLDEEMGGNRPCVLVGHLDSSTGMQEVHFVKASVDQNTGKVFSGPPGHGQLFRQFERAMEKAEITHGLNRVLARKAIAEDELKQGIATTRSYDVRAPHTVDFQSEKRTGVVPKDEALKQAVLTARVNAQDFGNFLDQVEAQGIRVQPNVATTGTVSGLSFSWLGQDPEHATKGSKLGAAFTWNKLSKELNYGNEHTPRLAEQATLVRTLKATLTECGGPNGANEYLQKLANDHAAARPTSKQQQPHSSGPTANNHSAEFNAGGSNAGAGFGSDAPTNGDLGQRHGSTQSEAEHPNSGSAPGGDRRIDNSHGHIADGGTTLDIRAEPSSNHAGRRGAKAIQERGPERATHSRPSKNNNGRANESDGRGVQSTRGIGEGGESEHIQPVGDTNNIFAGSDIRRRIQLVHLDEPRAASDSKSVLEHPGTPGVSNTRVGANSQEAGPVAVKHEGLVNAPANITETSATPLDKDKKPNEDEYIATDELTI